MQGGDGKNTGEKVRAKKGSRWLREGGRAETEASNEHGDGQVESRKLGAGIASSILAGGPVGRVRWPPRRRDWSRLASAACSWACGRASASYCEIYCYLCCTRDFLALAGTCLWLGGTTPLNTSRLVQTFRVPDFDYAGKSTSETPVPVRTSFPMQSLQLRPGIVLVERVALDPVRNGSAPASMMHL